MCVYWPICIIYVPKYLNCIAGYLFMDMHDYTAAEEDY